MGVGGMLKGARFSGNENFGREATFAERERARGSFGRSGDGGGDGRMIFNGAGGSAGGGEVGRLKFGGFDFGKIGMGDSVRQLGEVGVGGSGDAKPMNRSGSDTAYAGLGDRE
jgi:hypothetical protein